MNAVNITGNLTKDPELIKGGKENREICKLRVGVGRGRNRDPVYADIKVFGSDAPRCAEYLTKGRGVAITGWLEYAEWNGEDGKKRTRLYVATTTVDFLSGRDGSADGENGNGNGRQSSGNRKGGSERFDRSRERGGGRSEQREDTALVADSGGGDDLDWD